MLRSTNHNLPLSNYTRQSWYHRSLTDVRALSCTFVYIGPLSASSDHDPPDMYYGDQQTQILPASANRFECFFWLGSSRVPKKTITPGDAHNLSQPR
ncbi:hypothetical protein IG631_13863 [Alternaria alternata]|nr:hypothetical protein IG631_13863 [Alternaria alternata]